jgi:cyclopropane-fatty-acyl-phospholipid synthase
MRLTEILLEKNLLPDALIRFGIRRRLAALLREKRPADISARQARLSAHIEGLKRSPVAIETSAANEQHYEVPTRFFQLCLGKHLKYSCGWWDESARTLDQSEAAMLRLTCERAEVRGGERILELGCGWGSLSLWMAEHYPDSQITSISNSRTQKEFIDAEAARRGLKNLMVRTMSMNDYAGEGEGVFDRVVSVEMFEHMKNYRELLRRTASWLKPRGKLFVHIFTHRDIAYHFEARNENEWLARHFFAGGQMPSADLLLHFQDDLRIEERWAVNGMHYKKTSDAWLARMDANRADIMPILGAAYGEANAAKWWARWRVFYMACAELWGFRAGNEWLVSHYRFVKP